MKNISNIIIQQIRPLQVLLTLSLEGKIIFLSELHGLYKGRKGSKQRNQDINRFYKSIMEVEGEDEFDLDSFGVLLNKKLSANVQGAEMAQRTQNKAKVFMSDGSLVRDDGRLPGREAVARGVRGEVGAQAGARFPRRDRARRARRA